MTLHPVILAGGSGTRLWPLSREFHPKQFLPLMGELSLLQETIQRLDGIKGIAAPLIVCNDGHRFLVMDQLRELGIQPLAVIVEPVGRNTAPALTLAALRLDDIVGSKSADPVMLVMPADHLIREPKVFQMAVGTGTSLAESGYMVTFGVLADGPETGYGYIRKGSQLGAMNDITTGTAYEVTAFTEKPDLDSAKAFVEDEGYLWNSGMFMMRTSVWLSELERYQRYILRACRLALSNGHADGAFYRPGAADFVACPSDSIDYAVMEKVVGKAKNGSSVRCAVVQLNAGWSDIGAWSALWEERDQDSQGNAIQGDVYTHSTENALLIAQHRLLATVGVKNVVVVETRDAILVAHKDCVQEVKNIVERLKADRRTEWENHRKVHRPWGSYEIVDAAPGFQVKRLTVNPGAALSLQKHRHRTEHWVVVKGTAKVTRGEEVFTLEENQSSYVPKGMAHRLENPSEAPLEIIEVQSGSYLGEDDILRLQDDYNRH